MYVYSNKKNLYKTSFLFCCFYPIFIYISVHQQLMKFKQILVKKLFCICFLIKSTVYIIYMYIEIFLKKRNKTVLLYTKKKNYNNIKKKVFVCNRKTFRLYIFLKKKLNLNFQHNLVVFLFLFVFQKFIYVYNICYIMHMSSYKQFRHEYGYIKRKLCYYELPYPGRQEIFFSHFAFSFNFFFFKVIL